MPQQRVVGLASPRRHSSGRNFGELLGLVRWFQQSAKRREVLDDDASVVVDRPEMAAVFATPVQHASLREERVDAVDGVSVTVGAHGLGHGFPLSDSGEAKPTEARILRLTRVR